MQQNQLETHDIHDISAKNKGRIEANSAKTLYAPVWQTFWWSELMIQTGMVENVWCIYDPTSFRGCFVQKRSLGVGQYGLFCIGFPGNDYLDASSLSNKLKSLGKKEGTLFVQMESLETLMLSGWKQKSYKRFIKSSTGLIDLSQDEDTILKAMKQKGRYNIKVAKKHEVEIALDNTVAGVDAFYDLLIQTTRRNQFHGNPKKYYQALCDVLESKRLGGLYLAKKDDIVVAASIFIYHEDMATYYYGASSNDNALRRYMGSYLLQWEAMIEAKKRGCRWFDFLGVADANGNPSHLAGVTDFKMKFGPQLHTWPSAQMHICKPVMYTLFRLLKILKR